MQESGNGTQVWTWYRTNGAKETLCVHAFSISTASCFVQAKARLKAPRVVRSGVLGRLFAAKVIAAAAMQAKRTILC